MTRVVTNYQTGVKYSFRPHGLKSKFLIAAASFVTALGSALMFGGQASAAVPSGGIAVTVCGDGASWYVNGDEGGADPKQGDRRPAATNVGLVFTNNDLIHHEVQPPLALSALKPGSFSYNSLPDQPSFFSVEVGNPGYATLRWDTTLNEWNIGGTSTYSADPTTFVGQKGLTAASTVLSFGVGYTNTPPGTVAVTVSSITFQGVLYNLACPAPAATVTVQIPGPTTVVTHDQFITVQATPTTTPSATPSASPSPSASPTPGPVATTPNRSAAPTMVPVANNSSPDYMLWIAVAMAILGGLVLLILIVSGIRRRRGQSYQAAHSSSGQTQLLPTVGDNYDISDYDPGSGYDPKLGGYPGANWALHSQDLPPADNSATVEFPPASEVEPPADSDTRPLPPA